MRKEELRTYIENHESEMIEDLKSLIRIPSEKQAVEPGKPFGAPAAEALAQGIEILEKYGFAVTNYDNYAIAADFNQEEKGLDILAHLDVVPAGEGWQETDPFTPLIKEGKMFGRGTADDKGPAIAAIYAMRAVKELGYPLKKNVRLVLGSDEECGSSDLEYYYKKEVEAPCTFSPDAEFPVINIEKGGMRGHFEKTSTICKFSHAMSIALARICPIALILASISLGVTYILTISGEITSRINSYFSRGEYSEKIRLTDFNSFDCAMAFKKFSIVSLTIVGASTTVGTPIASTGTPTTSSVMPTR